MNETISLSPWLNRISSGVISVALFTSSDVPVFDIERPQQYLLKGTILSSYSSSRCEFLPGEIKTWQQIRIEKIKSLRGKYRTVLTPSNEFALQKDNDIEIESA